MAIISFMYRYLAVLGGEAGRMNRAKAVAIGRRRRVGGGGSLRWRAGVTGSMVGSLFLRSYERSERIYAAMLARGFQGELLREDLADGRRARAVAGRAWSSGSGWSRSSLSTHVLHAAVVTTEPRTVPSPSTITPHGQMPMSRPR